MIRVPFAALAAVLMAFPALAETPVAGDTPVPDVAPAAPSSDGDNGRYTFNQTPDGLLRLDGRTGHVSICSRREVGWACQIVPDERAALETEITRLQNESVTLKRALIERGIALPSGSRAPDAPAAKSNELVLKLPSDADLDRARTFIEKMWSRLVEMVQNIRKAQEKGS
jgi:hypothetical protein